MYSPLTLAYKYISWWHKASNSKGHGMHSPFVFDFITNILNDRSGYPAYDKVEKLRKKLLKDKTVLMVDDLGAGSGHAADERRTIALIARNASKPKKWGQFLYRLVKYYQPGNILELGTSLGISTAYLALGNSDAKLTSLEGAPMIASKAKENLDGLGIKNVDQWIGNFDELLPKLIDDKKTWDLVFVDGNHRKEPTLKYFEWILTNTDSGSIIIFDDNHWSEEMEEAWEIIRKDPRVRCSLDLFFVGLVFFRDEFHEKLDFSIRT